MKKTTIKIFMLAVLFGFSTVAMAQDEEEKTPLEISGSVDMYYRANLNATNDGDVGLIAPGTSFANRPGFSLGMANIVLQKNGEKAGFVADLVFGPRGEDAVFGSPLNSVLNGSLGGSAQIINQLYAYWNVSDAATITIGNFNTFLGYEVISPTSNFNYSTSYMFSYGPFSHTGIKADFSFGDFSLMTALMNTTDATEFSPDGKYFGGVQLGYGGAYLNFLFDNDFFQADLTGGWDLSDSFYLGVNATTASDNFYGAALYLQNSFSDSFSMGLRGEYFSDEGVGALPDLTEDGGPVATNVIDLTLTANATIGDLTFIPEIRIDVYDEDVIIPDANEAAQGSLASFVLAAVYSF